MKHKNLCLDVFTEREAALARYEEQNAEPDFDYQRLKKSLRRALEGELTDRQRECVELYYFHNLSGREAALELGVTEATVSRHLRKARARIGRVLGYTFPKLSS